MEESKFKQKSIQFLLKEIEDHYPGKNVRLIFEPDGSGALEIETIKTNFKKLQEYDHSQIDIMFAPGTNIAEYLGDHLRDLQRIKRLEDEN